MRRGTGREPRPGGLRTILPEGLVVVEGVCALHRMFRDAYDVRVWVEAPYDVRLARGVERDGEAARDDLGRALDAERGPLRRARRPDPVGARRRRREPAAVAPRGLAAAQPDEAWRLVIAGPGSASRSHA